MTTTETRQGVRIYRAGDSPELHETEASSTDFGEHEEYRGVATTLATANCSHSRLLVHQKADQGGFNVLYLYFKPNFPLFHHKHDTDSMYVAISGSAVDFLNETTLRPAQCGFVPQATTYWSTAGQDGVEVLEMFHAVEHLTVIMAETPPGRLEQAEAALRDNIDTWKKIEKGPLFVANES